MQIFRDRKKSHLIKQASAVEVQKALASALDQLTAADVSVDIEKIEFVEPEVDERCMGASRTRICFTLVESFGRDDDPDSEQGANPR